MAMDLFVYSADISLNCCQLEEERSVEPWGLL